MDELPEDLAAEIFVRLPPYPRCVLTISATRKNWRQFMGSNYFRKLSLLHNGGIPLLGFYTNSSEDKQFISEHSIDTDMLNKLATISMGTSISNRMCVIGCRNGRVLLHHPVESRMHVWDPIKNIHAKIGSPPNLTYFNPASSTILYSRNHDGGLFPHCCHSSNFWVVCITTDNGR